jgi:hypothetical protein
MSFSVVLPNVIAQLSSLLHSRHPLLSTVAVAFVSHVVVILSPLQLLFHSCCHQWCCWHLLKHWHHKQQQSVADFDDDRRTMTTKTT